MTTFRIQSQAYHRLGSLLPPGNETHKYLQIYFCGDTVTETETRLSFTVRNARDRLKDREVVVMLQEMHHNHNKLVRQFKNHLADLDVSGQRLVIRGDKTPADEHRGRYNAPTAPEVAVIIAGEDGRSTAIVLEKSSSGLVRIS